jgi:hypothetical protein
MTSRNDVTGDLLSSKPATDSFRDGWERIFGKNKESKQDVVVADDTSTEEIPESK